MALVDLPEIPSGKYKGIYGEHPPERLALGVYKSYFGWLDKEIYKDFIISDSTFDDELRAYFETQRVVSNSGGTPDRYPQDKPQDYGVCDSWEQVTHMWPQLLTDSRLFTIWVSDVYRKDQPPNGGWRYHKWGPYIGTLSLECEYLYDDIHIEKVQIFSVVQMKNLGGV